MSRPRIAVVGSGISGLAAAWLLRDRHQVTLYEAEPRLGGHTHTIDVECDGLTHPIDTGFLVFNDRTYPNLVGLFRHLDVPVATSDMSFSVQVESERLEWAGTGLATLFAQKRNLVNRKFWRMLGDILRFNRDAPRQLAQDTLGELTVGEFLERGRYSAAFADWYLLPMAAAIWSCPVDAMREFPVASFVRFFDNHGLLGIANRPRWMTVRGGAREYVRRMAADLADVRPACPVGRITRDAHGVSVASECGVERYDQVVIAAHSDRAIAMLGDATDAERDTLGAVRYQPNDAIVHSDASFLPRRREAWAAWNYLSSGAAGGHDRPVSVSYLINRLQPLPFRSPVLVTLNAHREPAADRVMRRLQYRHPVFDQAAIAAQRRLPGIQGVRRTWYCGAWTRYGFHEDGLRSAVAVARALGCALPWRSDLRAA